MIENNRNNEQIYGRNDMIMLDQNNKIYGSLGIADKYVMKTEEGTMLVLKNPKSGKFGDVLTEFNMYGKSEQKQYSGKNLLKIRDGTQTERGVTVTVNDGVVALKGTATATGWTTFKIDSFTLNGTYILSSNFTDVTVRLANKSYKAVISQNESKTLENEEVSVLCFVVKEGITYDISNILVQIEKGSKVTSYEPYVGGQPSPSPDYPQEIKSVGDSGSIELNVRGKNLWDNFKKISLGNVEQKNGTYISTADTMQVDITGNSIGARPLLLKANNAYTFSLKTTVSISSFRFVCLLYTNGESDNIAFTNKNFVNFVPKRDVEKIGFILYGSVAGDKVYDVQLEIGSEATSYEPYQEEQTAVLPYTLNAIPVSSGGNYTDQSGQQWICDEINLNRGVKIQRVYKVDVDGENIKFIQSDRYANISEKGLPIALYDIGQRIYGISTFTNLSWFYNTLTGQFLYLIAPDISDKINESCKKQMGKIYYALATPIEIPLTNDEIAAFNALKTYYPVTIIENNYNTWMKATYKSTESV